MAASGGWGSVAGGWDNDSDDGGPMEFTRASAESNHSTTRHTHDESEDAIERRQREAADGLRAASASRSPRRRSPAQHSPPRRRTSSRADKRDGGAESARSRHANNNKNNNNGGSQQTAGGSHATAPPAAEANSLSPPATTQETIGGWQESPLLSPQVSRRAGMADEGMPKRRVRSGDAAAASGSAAAAATPGILPLQTTRPSAFNPPTRPSVSGRAKVAPSSGRAPFNSGGKASVRAKGKGDGAAEFRKTAASGRPLHRKAALNEVKEKLTNHDASDALAKWLEKKRLREQRLAQRRQYGAIRMNPVLVSAVEVNAPDALSPRSSDVASVRGSVSVDGGLPALVGVGMGGGGGHGGGGGGGVGMDQQQQRGKQRFSGRPKPQPDPLPKRVVAANASSRRVNTVGSGPSGSPSLAAASRSKAAGAAAPRHLQPMANAPEPPLRELPPATQGAGGKQRKPAPSMLVMEALIPEGHTAPPLPEPLSPLRPFRPNNLSCTQADDLGPALSPMPSQAPDAFPHSNWDRNTPSPRPRGLSSQQSTTASVYEMMDDDMEQQHPRLAGLSAVNLDDRYAPPMPGVSPYGSELEGHFESPTHSAYSGSLDKRFHAKSGGGGGGGYFAMLTPPSSQGIFTPQSQAASNGASPSSGSALSRSSMEVMGTDVRTACAGKAPRPKRMTVAAGPRPGGGMAAAHAPAGSPQVRQVTGAGAQHSSPSWLRRSSESFHSFAPPGMRSSMTGSVSSAGELEELALADLRDAGRTHSGLSTRHVFAPPPPPVQRAGGVGVERPQPPPSAESETALERNVLRAIHDRDQLLDEMRALSAQAEANGLQPGHDHGLERLLPRVWGLLQTATLDVVEAVVAWQARRAAATGGGAGGAGARAGFIYGGEDYLMRVGSDLIELEGSLFVRTYLSKGVSPCANPFAPARAFHAADPPPPAAIDPLRVRMAATVLKRVWSRSTIDLLRASLISPGGQQLGGLPQGNKPGGGAGPAGARAKDNTALFSRLPLQSVDEGEGGHGGTHHPPYAEINAHASVPAEDNTHPTTPLEPISERHSLRTPLAMMPSSQYQQYHRCEAEEAAWSAAAAHDRTALTGTSAGSMDSYRSGTPSGRNGQLSYPSPLQLAAAVCIQSHYRGYSARAKVMPITNAPAVDRPHPNHATAAHDLAAEQREQQREEQLAAAALPSPLGSTPTATAAGRVTPSLGTESWAGGAMAMDRREAPRAASAQLRASEAIIGSEQQQRPSWTSQHEGVGVTARSAPGSAATRSPASRQAARDAFWADEAVDALVEAAVMSAEVMSPHTSPSPLPPSQHHQQQQQPNNAQLYQHKPILLNMEDPAAITTTAAAAAAAAVAGSDGSGQVAEEAEVDVTAETEVEDDLHMQDCTYGVQLYAPTAPLDASLTALEDEDFVMMHGGTFDSPTSPPARGQAVLSEHVHVRCEETAEGTVAVWLSTAFVPPAAPTLHARPAEAGSLGLRRTAAETASAAQQPAEAEAEAPEAAQIETAAAEATEQPDKAEAPEAARIETAAAEAAEQPDKAEAPEAARIEAAAAEAAERSSDEAVSPFHDRMDDGTEALEEGELQRPTLTWRPVESTTAAAETAEAAVVWMEMDGGGNTEESSLTLKGDERVEESFDAIICGEALAEQTVTTVAEREGEGELERSLSPSGGNDYLEHSDLADAGNAIVSPSFLEQAAASCIQEAYREHRQRLSDVSPVRARHALGDNADDEDDEDNNSQGA